MDTPSFQTKSASKQVVDSTVEHDLDSDSSEDDGEDEASVTGSESSKERQSDCDFVRADNNVHPEKWLKENDEP